MNEITAITAQKKNAKRVSIFINGDYHCSLDKMAVVTFGIKVGDIISEERLSKIILDSEEKSAFDSGIRYLCIRMRTVSEVIRYLEDKGYLKAAIENTVKKLTEYGYLNDGEFCKSYIKSYRQKYGDKKLIYELNRLGIDESFADKLVKEEGGDETEACEKAAEKYVRTRSKQVTQTKLVTFLYSKGFDIDTAKTVAKNLLTSYK